jgi:hypothetical protein
MPKYRVNLFYHGSASYDVEAADKGSALGEARRLNALQPEKEFRERLILDYVDADVYEEKED